MAFKRFLMLPLLFGLSFSPCAAVSEGVPYSLDCREFGAIGDSVVDDTTAIQTALNQAGKNGGGVVFLPAGTYRIEGNLTVPSGVTLQGIWNSPHHEDRTWGTALFAVGGRDNPTGPALVELSPSSAVRGLKIYYPDQIGNDIHAYPYAVRGRGMEYTVENVTLVNAYQGIDCSPVHELHLIRNVHGCVLKQGIIVDRCTDIGRIENVHFNPHFWARCLPAPGKEAIPLYRDWKTVVAFINENLDAFVFARSDWEYVLNTFAWGFKTCYKFIETEGGSCNGNFLGIGADGGQYCLWVEKTQPPGLLITNGQFVAFSGEKPTSVVTTPDFVGLVQLNNCSFWGPAHQCVRQEGNGVVSLSQCNFQQWGAKDEDAFAVETIMGDLTVTDCVFQMNRPHIRVGEDAGRAIIRGNRYRKAKRVKIENLENPDRKYETD